MSNETLLKGPKRNFTNILVINVFYKKESSQREMVSDLNVRNDFMVFQLFIIRKTIIPQRGKQGRIIKLKINHNTLSCRFFRFVM